MLADKHVVMITEVQFLRTRTLMWTVLLLAAVAPLRLPREHPLGRWLEQASSGGEPSASGQLLLAGNTTAHGPALRAALAGAAREEERRRRPV